MNILIKNLNSRLRIILTIAISAFITIAFQSSAFSNEDKEKIVALTNWATIEYPDLFFKNYDGPLSGFGYRYTCFPANNNCIGIKDGTNNLDVLIDGEIIPIGPATNIMGTMAASNNGILNLSGTSVDLGVIPSVFSPGNGILATVDTQGTATFRWMVATDPEKCILSATFNIEGNSVIKLTLSREAESGNTVDQWILSSSDNTSLKGVEHDSTTLKIVENIALDQVLGGSNTLMISADGTLKFKFP